MIKTLLGDKTSPILYGYDRNALSIMYKGDPILAVSAGGGFGGATTAGPRVLLSCPNDPNDLLLSGELVGGENLVGRPALVDTPLGKGHVVLFGIRPCARGQTQGSCFLTFNAILNSNDLNAGRAGATGAGR